MTAVKATPFAERLESDARALENELEAIDTGRLPRIELPRLHRAACANLALARTRGYPPASVDALNDLVVRSHHALYAAPGPTLAGAARLLDDFPRAVRARAGVFAAIALVFLGTLGAIDAAVRQNPALATSLLGADVAADFVSMYSNPDGPAAREVDSDFYMFGYYVWNNTGIGLRTIGAGAAGGVGALYVVVSNAVQLGAVQGHVIASGHGDQLREFVASHTPFELTAIVLAGGAGLLLGLAVIAPGRRTRVDALRHVASELLPVLYGVVALFILAAFIEAFWSSNVSVPAAWKHATGVVLWVATLAYLALGGRGHAGR